MTEVEQMTDWAEMPAPSPEMMEPWMKRLGETMRADRIEALVKAGAVWDFHVRQSIDYVAVHGAPSRRAIRDQCPAIFEAAR